MICPHCQSENPEGSKYCNGCGFPLTGLLAQSEADNGAASLASSTDSDDEESERAPVDFPHTEVHGLNNDENGKSFDPLALDVEFDFDDVEIDDDDGDSASPVVPVDGDREMLERLPAIEEREAGGEAALSEATTTFDLSDDAPALRGATQQIGGEPPETAPPTADLLDQDSTSETAGFDTLGVTGEIWRSDGTMELPLVADPKMPQKSGYRAPEGGLRKRRRLPLVSLIVIIVVLALAGTAAAVTYSLEIWGGKAVPNVVGMTQADATYTLESRGFTVRATEVVSDETEGLVLLSDPGGGGRAEEGSEVVIHVSVARTIPELLGMSQGDAQAALSEAGYTRVSVVTEKSNESEGTVLAVEPEVGTKANASTAVTLTVAEPYYVPNVVGMTQDEARATLEAEGYVVAVSRTYTEDYAEGVVMSIDPVGGTQLNSGSTVTIYVATSRAQELINVTYGLIYEGANLSVGGVNYTVTRLDAVAYQGNNTVSYTFTGIPYTYFLGVRIELDATSVSGSLVFGDNNELQSSLPSFSIAS